MQGQGVDEVSIEELASNLSLYKDQLNQVRELLNDDPANSEYVDMERELSEVIALTEELLATAKQNEISAPPNNAAASPTLSIHNENQLLDSSSDHQEKLPVGTKVQAVWSEDGEWYDATIEAYTPNGYYVSYDNWGNKEEVRLLKLPDANLISIASHRVDPANVRSIQEGSVDALLEAERVAEATKQAIKRKIAQAASIDLQSRSLPTKLRIEADDPEDVKASKRKKIHAFKSKMRMEQLEVTQNKRQNAWQQFQSTKGKAKKIGFFSGRKRESIFKSPDDPQGKVGVTGSGKGLTEFQKREKHFHLKDGTVENDD
ncbi:Survival of motor neuron-related-splicing factor 30 [Glycine soja]